MSPVVSGLVDESAEPDQPGAPARPGRTPRDAVPEDGPVVLNAHAVGGRRYRTEVRVRWSDLDAFGHVNNARTLTLLEEARVDWLFVDAARSGVDRLTDGIVVSRLAITYRRAIGFGSPVMVSMWVSKLAAASFTVAYEVHAAGQLASEASTVLVPVDSATFRPRRLSAIERDYLAEFLGG